MTNAKVGVENLPNVFISQISLENNNTESFKVEIDIELWDFLENDSNPNSFLWSEDDVFSDFIKIGILTTTSNNLNNNLKNGFLSPVLSDLKKSPYYDDKTQLKTLSTKEFSLFKTKNSKKFYTKCSYIVKKRTRDYYVYVYAYVDTAGLSKHLNIDMTGDLKKYCGPVKSEIILEASEPRKISSLFLKPDNTVWSGPVHLHNEEYMAGAKHTSKKHSSLRKINVKNLKLKDNRGQSWENRQPIETSLTPFISDLHHSFNNNASLTGVFMINMTQFMLLNIKNARKILGASPKLFQELMDAISINSMSVIRQQVRTIRGSNKAGTIKFGTEKVNTFNYISTSTEQSPNQLKNTENLQQIYINKDPGVRYYQFIDNDMTMRSKGEFKYKLKCTAIDRAEQFVDQKIMNLSSGLNNLKRIVEMLGRRVKYDYQENKLKPGVTIPPSVVDYIETYYVSLSYLKQITPSQVQELINNKLSLFMAGTYSPILAERFIIEYSDLITEFRQKFQSKNKHNSTKKPKNLKKSFLPGLIKFEKEWSDIISFNEFRRSYDCLGVKDNDGLAILSFDEISSRANIETNRFFDPGKGLDSEDILELPISIQSDIKDLTSSRLVYYAPIGFKLDEESIDITDISKVDNKNLTTKFLKSQEVKKSIKRPSRNILKKKSKRTKRANRKISKRKRSKSKIFSLHRWSIKIKPSPKKVSDLIKFNKRTDSREYLGNNSEFVTPEELNKSTIPPEDKKSITTEIMSTLNINTDRNKENYDLEAPNNFLDDIVNSKSFKRSTLKNAPNQFKALIASRADGVRNNILGDEDGDVLKSPDTKVISEILFQTLQKLEMMAGYDKDQFGTDIVTSPIWVPFDTSLFIEGSTVLCRLVYTEIPKLGITVNSDFRLPVQNSVFMISERDILEKTESPSYENVTSNINFKTQSSLSINILYARTNIVKQNIQGLNKKLMNSSDTSTSSNQEPIEIENTRQTNQRPTMAPSSGGGSY
tara:strand:- start:6194 stop:9163 length:2970 start_codon:yes stop_codon:yes gene_type:complete